MKSDDDQMLLSNDDSSSQQEKRDKSKDKKREKKDRKDKKDRKKDKKKSKKRDLTDDDDAYYEAGDLKAHLESSGGANKSSKEDQDATTVEESSVTTADDDPAAAASNTQQEYNSVPSAATSKTRTRGVLRHHSFEEEPRRHGRNVVFSDELVAGSVEFDQECDAPLKISVADHVAQDHNQIPWEEQPDKEEGLPWWECESEDDADKEVITMLCRKVVKAAGKKYRKGEVIRAGKVESLVIHFALKLKHKARNRRRRKRQQENGGFVSEGASSDDDSMFEGFREAIRDAEPRFPPLVGSPRRRARRRARRQRSNRDVEPLEDGGGAEDSSDDEDVTERGEDVNQVIGDDDDDEGAMSALSDELEKGIGSEAAESETETDGHDANEGHANNKHSLSKDRKSSKRKDKKKHSRKDKRLDRKSSSRKKDKKETLAEEALLGLQSNAKIKKRKKALERLKVQFISDDDDKLVSDALEFDPDEAPLSISDPNHVAEEHNEIPWDEADYEEIPWWDQPDLDEDDEVTALCKRILLAGAKDGECTANHEIQADRIQSLVIQFALKVHQRIQEMGTGWRMGESSSQNLDAGELLEEDEEFEQDGKLENIIDAAPLNESVEDGRNPALHAVRAEAKAMDGELDEGVAEAASADEERHEATTRSESEGCQVNTEAGVLHADDGGDNAPVDDSDGSASFDSSSSSSSSAPDVERHAAVHTRVPQPKPCFEDVENKRAAQLLLSPVPGTPKGGRRGALMRLRQAVLEQQKLWGVENQTSPRKSIAR